MYLDYNSTAPLNDTAKDSYLDALNRFWGNASSQHSLGRASAAALEQARDSLGALFSVDPRRVRFTSGATESNSWLMKSVLNDSELKKDGKTLRVVSAVEHPSILSYGDVFLPVDSTGIIQMDKFNSIISEHKNEIAIVSVMSVNNETGVIQPVNEMYRICKEAGILFHTDASQEKGRLNRLLEADFITFSGHKLGAPQGVGGLILNRELVPLLEGGPQERESRAGTVNVPGIVAMGAIAQDLVHFQEWDLGVRQVLEDCCISLGGEVLGSDVERLPNTVCALFPVPGDLIVMALDMRGIQVSTGSACSSGAHKQSHVLKAMGYSGAPVRFSWGYHTFKNQDISQFVSTLTDTVKALG